MKTQTKKKILYERMCSLIFYNTRQFFNIRCWIKDEKGNSYWASTQRKIEAFVKLKSKDVLYITAQELAEEIIDKFNISAIEVLDDDKNGPILYADWP